MRLKKHLMQALALTLLIAQPAHVGASTDGAKVIAGWVERVVILPAGHDVKAKLDSGARTSSINARNIETFKRDGKKWARFTLSYEDSDDQRREQTLELPVARRIRVKEHEGENDRRVVVELPLCFDGRRTSAQFSLVDRSRFIYPVLLGRRFLENRAVIDPSATFQTANGCPPPAPEQ